MALDEPNDKDEVFKDNGNTYVVDKTLFEQAKPITVDFVQGAMGSGFMVSSSIPSNGGCSGSCSGC